MYVCMYSSVFLGFFVFRFLCLLVTEKLGSLTVYPACDTYSELHDPWSALVRNPFALTVC